MPPGGYRHLIQSKCWINRFPLIIINKYNIKGNHNEIKEKATRIQNIVTNTQRPIITFSKVRNTEHAEMKPRTFDDFVVNRKKSSTY